MGWLPALPARTAPADSSLVRQDGATAYRRTFEEPIPGALLGVALNRTGLRTLRRTRRLGVRVSLDRPGLVRVRATVTRVRRGRTSVVRLAHRVVSFSRAGRQRFFLRVSPRGAAALRRPGRLRITLTGRHRGASGRTLVRRARRPLR